METKNIAIIGIVALILIAVLAVTSGVFNTNSSTSGEITVLAGAGFTKVGNELVTAFNKKYPDSKVIMKYGGSGELFGTLQTTKSGDVFMPADYKYMQDAMNSEFIENDTVQNITKNIPVIAVAKGNPKNINSLDDLANSGIKVGIGDAKGPAIGKTTAKILNASNLTSTVESNVVVKTTTVNQLLTYLISGQVDAVIIWEDMATWEESKGKIEIVNISESQNKVSTVPIAVTTFTENKALAQKFEEFVVSPEGQAIWKKWGFEPIS
ncbi:molybdate ABC transporter substrate-binding protein [Methanobacterium alcaliphilum]|uniref:molybdate ABC transporter substrate-binding protein n=1 Tax=Methanobacterium alcaliphilum TaxID=392018 RepID=UPI00200B02B2|nr:molybdate ABC transporter substrate-binding protein [Methanobacterium alcaliphilum]MCK9151960.1 molybdate ABC transporter substrate-binding protein [Methanobacterium alcaliphilum]